MLFRNFIAVSTAWSIDFGQGVPISFAEEAKALSETPNALVETSLVTQAHSPILQSQNRQKQKNGPTERIYQKNQLIVTYKKDRVDFSKAR